MTASSFLADLGARAPAVLSILVFRSIPFVLYACVARSLPWPRRLFVVGAALGGGWLASRADPGVAQILVWTPVVVACGLAGAALVHRLARWLPRGWIKRGAVLALSAALFMVLPAALLHHPVVGACLILGWEITLSAHSYCVAVSSAAYEPRFRDCLFFLLVNPTVLYPERGAPIAGGSRAVTGALGFLRVARGVVTMAGRDVALVLVSGTALLSRVRPDDGLARVCARFFCTQLVLLLGLYCAHSGLASVQIGWMRVIGHTVPERYRHPLLARSPQDFWHRWNIWVSRWAHRYLFVPIALALGHRWRSGAGRAGPLVAALLTFAGVGVLHDLGVYSMRLEIHQASASFGFTLLFVSFGLVLVVWAEIARRAGPWMRSVSPGARAVARSSSRLALLAVALGLSWLALPLLRTGHLPPALEALLRR